MRTNYAFPGNTSELGQHPGMTVREYFACQALVGLLAFPADRQCNAEEAAEQAVAYADALLDELARP